MLHHLPQADVTNLRAQFGQASLQLANVVFRSLVLLRTSHLLFNFLYLFQDAHLQYHEDSEAVELDTSSG